MFLLAAGILLAGYLAWRLLVATDAKRITRIMERARQGVVRRDLNTVMANVDPSYRDDFGHDYAKLYRWFEYLFHDNDSIVCTFSRLRTVVEHQDATCSLLVTGAGYGRSGRGSESDDGFPLYSEELVVYLHKYDTGWRIVSASQ